jgi:hypothetical protein
VIIFCLPYSPLGVPGNTGFTLNYVNYAPVVVVGVMLAVTIWYFGWAHKTFKGPIRTIDDAPTDGGAVPPAAQAVA